ncbi:MAG: hypothetical protein HN737_06220 [Desulfobacterales bacterium]|jgi:hypothetical protein|nr:hypothetical protein [Desulfobacteraceae bacterium]MBT7084571.1 hypothetical protein [Desulfobacterales bacterium]MBT7696986.1 hypothetical protein [Desulfobacterales bacterium]
MQQKEEKKFIQFGKSLEKNLKINIYMGDDGLKVEFKAFGEKLASLVPKIDVTIKKSDDDQPSAIQIHERIRFHAIPVGTEIDIFLDALKQVASGVVKLPDSVLEKLRSVDVPARCKLFIAQYCPHCPVVVQQIIPLVIECGYMHISIIDGTLFPKETETFRIMSAPTLLLDDDFRWTGSVPVHELVDAMNDRDPSQLGASSLEGIIKDGNASLVAEMMLKSRSIFQSFYELLMHEKWPVRLGAMVVMEEVIEKDKTLAAGTINPLLEKFPEMDDQVKGDILYLIGESGNYSNISELEKIISGEYSVMVKEAAGEAIESINCRA